MNNTVAECEIKFIEENSHCNSPTYRINTDNKKVDFWTHWFFCLYEYVNELV